MESKMKFNSHVYNTVYQAFRPFIGKITFLLILGFISRLVFLSNAKVIGEAVDRTDAIDKPFLISLSYQIFILLSVSIVLTLIYRVMFSRLSAKAISTIYDETTFRTSRFPLSFFDQTAVGKISTRFSSDYGNAFRLFGGPLAEFISIVFDLISIFIIICWINILYIIPLLIAAVLYYFILKMNENTLRTNRSLSSTQRGPSIAHFSETVQGALCIRQDSRQNSFLNRFNELDNLFTTAKKNVFKSVFTFSLQLSVMSLLVFLLNAAISVYLFEKKVLGAGEITVVISYTLLATTALQMFFEWYSQFDEALIGVSRLDEYIRTDIEAGAYLPAESSFDTGHPKLAPDAPLSVPSTRKLTLEIENLSLKYETQDHETLKNITLTIPPGSKVGIIGRTGSGKTSLIAAILKLYPYSKGSVSFKEYTPFSVDDYRKQFAVISQDTFFIRGSLKDNIDFNHMYSDADLADALHRVGIDLPLSTYVEENGNNLSQGEKQLISLCRGLLKNSPIIIFDEATANIDPQSEATINDILMKTLQEHTQIIIAHRLDTVKKCDFILWLSDGQIKKFGPPKEILEAFITTG